MPTKLARAGRKFLPTLPLSFRGQLNPAEWNRASFYALAGFVFVFAFVFSAVRLALRDDPAGSYVAPPVATVVASLAALAIMAAMLYIQYYQGVDLQHTANPGGSPDNVVSPDRLLIVEDDAMVAAALRKLLSRDGWEVDWAPTVTAAKMALAHRPKWVLLDMMLPDGWGVDVLRAVKQGGLPIKVAVVSGLAREEIERKLGDLEPDAIIPKPWKIGDLMGLIGGPGAEN